jgi:hypothetical protein
MRQKRYMTKNNGLIIPDGTVQGFMLKQKGIVFSNYSAMTGEMPVLLCCITTYDVGQPSRLSKIQGFR